MRQKFSTWLAIAMGAAVMVLALIFALLQGM